MQHITVQISQQVEMVVFGVNFIHQDFKSTKIVVELGGRYHELAKKGLEYSLVISITRHSNWLITIKICLCVLSAKMFENPDVSGLLSLHQWKMPLH